MKTKTVRLISAIDFTKSGASLLAKFTFRHIDDDLIVEVFDDGTWEVIENDGEEQFLVQQGYWNKISTERSEEKKP